MSENKVDIKKASKVVYPKLLKALVGDEQADEIMGKIGTYKMAPGGGTPLAKGQKAPDAAWVAAHRSMQPRDEGGRFTYNSVNAIPLAESSQPFRGKQTIPPFLLGKTILFAKEKSDKTAVIYDGKRYITGYDVTRDGFLKQMKLAAGVENIVLGEGDLKGKVGRPSKTELSTMKERTYGVVKTEFAETLKEEKEKVNKANPSKKGFVKKQPKVEEKNDNSQNKNDIEDKTSSDIDNLFNEVFGK